MATQKKWEKYNNPFPVRLRAVMDRKPKTTQKELGDSIGKSRQVVSQYCNGESEPPYETLVQISKHFDVSVDYLLGITNDSKKCPTATDELQLGERSVEQINAYQDGFLAGRSFDLNFLYTLDSYWAFIDQLMDHAASIAAMQISGRIYKETHDKARASGIDPEMWEEADLRYTDAIRSIAAQKIYNERTSSFLLSMMHLKLLTWEDDPNLLFSLHGVQDIADLERIRTYDLFSILLDDVRSRIGVEHNAITKMKCTSAANDNIIPEIDISLLKADEE